MNSVRFSARWLSILVAAWPPSFAVAQWDAKVKYDGQVLSQGPVTPIFTRNKPTVDDNGAPLAANVRRFAAKPVGIADYVDWQTALPSALGTDAILLGSGPGT